MSDEIISQVKTMIAAGTSHRAVARHLKISMGTIHIILTGKKYKKGPTADHLRLRGLGGEQKRIAKNIAKNKDYSLNRLLLSYIRAGIAAEPAQNKIYED